MQVDRKKAKTVLDASPHRVVAVFKVSRRSCNCLSRVASLIGVGRLAVLIYRLAFYVRGIRGLRGNTEGGHGYR